MRCVPLLAVLLLGCGPVAQEPCVEVEWEVVLHDTGEPDDVFVRDDGIVGVLTYSALLEFDERGVQVGEHRLVGSNGETLSGRRLYADAQRRWWLTAGHARGDGGYDSWILRIDPDGTIEAKKFSEEGELGLVPLLGWGEHVLVGGFDFSEEYQPDDEVPPGFSNAYPVAKILELDERLETVDAWTSVPELGSTGFLFDLQGQLLVLAKPPSIDWAHGELLRLDAFDQPPAWQRTVGLLGAGFEGVFAVASTDRHALLLSGTQELVDPDAEFEPPEIPDTQMRTSIDAWGADGEIEWTHDLWVGSASAGKLAASDRFILGQMLEHVHGQTPKATLLVVDHDGARVCEGPANPARSLLLEAAPAWGPDAFVHVERDISDEPGPDRLVRLRVAR